ncbi:anaerobic ribonucleoside-triphosphate reductase activating protein [Cytophagaceae bacterium ABcell3]|nr:anaerobic ribonucleoside-triphosphate reductase activating protein [Cytophagaceae bacterium ABcell3]
MNINKENISLKTEEAVKPVYSITPFTMLDYPEHTACILWFAGCNMKCPYCYNPEIVYGKGQKSYAEVLEFLQTRKNLLEGVVLSGGEFTLHKGLEAFLYKVKKLGLKVKADTNGSNPQILKRLTQQKLIDYIALDFKAPLNHFQEVTRSHLFPNFETAIDYLLSENFPFEVRTTVHTKQLDQQSLQDMLSYLEGKNYQGEWFLQNFVNNTPTLGNLPNSYKKIKPFDIPSQKIKIIVRN